MLLGYQGVDIAPRNSVIWLNGFGERFCIIDEEGLRFTPPHENDTKEELAKWFVESLAYLWSIHDRGNNVIFRINNDTTTVLTLTEIDIICDEPAKPFDFWTLNLAKKLWKERKRETT